MKFNGQSFKVLRRLLKWVGGLFLAITLLIVLIIAFFNWNWLRGPIERMATEKTGRQLVINGDLSAHLAWPRPSFRAERITFANLKPDRVWTVIADGLFRKRRNPCRIRRS